MSAVDDVKVDTSAFRKLLEPLDRLRRQNVRFICLDHMDLRVAGRIFEHAPEIDVVESAQQLLERVEIETPAIPAVIVLGEVGGHPLGERRGEPARAQQLDELIAAAELAGHLTQQAEHLPCAPVRRARIGCGIDDPHLVDRMRVLARVHQGDFAAEGVTENCGRAFIARGGQLIQIARGGFNGVRRREALGIAMLPQIDEAGRPLRLRRGEAAHDGCPVTPGSENAVQDVKHSGRGALRNEGGTQTDLLSMFHDGSSPHSRFVPVRLPALMTNVLWGLTLSSMSHHGTWKARPMNFGTIAIHGGQEPDPTTGAIMPPIYQTSTYVQPALGEPLQGYEYARVQNPTREAMERNIAALEAAEHGIAFASGMAAIEAIVKRLSSGDHVVYEENVYGGTHRMFVQV